MRAALLCLGFILHALAYSDIKPLQSEFSAHTDVRPGNDAFKRGSDSTNNIFISEFVGKDSTDDIDDRFRGHPSHNSDNKLDKRIYVDEPIPNLLDGRLTDLPAATVSYSSIDDNYQKGDELLVEAINYQPSTTNYEPSTIKHELPTTIYESSTIINDLLNGRLPDLPDTTVSYSSVDDNHQLGSELLVETTTYAYEPFKTTYELSTTAHDSSTIIYEDILGNSDIEKMTYDFVAPLKPVSMSENQKPEMILTYNYATAMPRNHFVHDEKETAKLDNIFAYNFVAPASSKPALSMPEEQKPEMVLTYNYATAIPRNHFHEEEIAKPDNIFAYNFVAPASTKPTSTKPAFSMPERQKSEMISTYNYATTTPINRIMQDEQQIVEHKDEQEELVPAFVPLTTSSCEGTGTMKAGTCRRHYFECIKGIRHMRFCAKLNDVFWNGECVPKHKSEDCASHVNMLAIRANRAQTYAANRRPISTFSSPALAFCAGHADGFYRHTSNCSRIIQCFDGEELEYPPCSNNLAFDEHTGVCNYRDQVEGCSSKSMTLEKKANVQMVASVRDGMSATPYANPVVDKSDAMSSIDLVGQSCQKHGDHLPNKIDCSGFYRCVWDRLVLMSCPSGTVFNPRLDVCDYPKNVPHCK